MELKMSNVVIKALGREIQNDEGFFNQDITSLSQTEGWQRNSLKLDNQVYSGPFCYIPKERDIPF